MTKNANRLFFVMWVAASAYLFGEQVGEYAAGGDLGLPILMGLVFVISVYLMIQTWNTGPQTGCELN